MPRQTTQNATDGAFRPEVAQARARVRRPLIGHGKKPPNRHPEQDVRDPGITRRCLRKPRRTPRMARSAAQPPPKNNKSLPKAPSPGSQAGVASRRSRDDGGGRRNRDRPSPKRSFTCRRSREGKVAEGKARGRMRSSRPGRDPKQTTSPCRKLPRLGARRWWRPGETGMTDEVVPARPGPPNETVPSPNPQPQGSPAAPTRSGKGF